MQRMTPEQRVAIAAMLLIVACFVMLALLPAGAPEPGYAPASTTSTRTTGR